MKFHTKIPRFILLFSLPELLPSTATMPRKQQPRQALTKQHFLASIEEIKNDAGAFIDRLLGEAEIQVQCAETFREIPSRAHEIGHAAAALL